MQKENTMINLEYFNGEKWVPAGGPFINETIAWISLGRDNINYRTVTEEGKVLTERR